MRNHIWISKELWNEILAFAKWCYREYEKFPTRKTLEEFTKNSGLYAQAGQAVAHRVEGAIWAFIKRRKVDPKAGFPRFKSFHHLKSLSYPQLGFKLLDVRHLKVTPFGVIPLRGYRELVGKIKTLTLKRESSGKWYAILVVEEPEVDFEPNGKKKIGVDMGLKSFATLSNGKKITNPRFYSREEEALARLQKETARKKLRSKNWLKAKVKIARLHERVADCRKDFLHKTSTELVNSYGLIALEKLQVQKMAQRNFGKQINDASWSAFARMLGYKAEEAGSQVIFVDPRGTSSSCSKCGLAREMPLSQRVFACDGCGLVLDRDLNAAKNILNRATAGYAGSNAWEESAMAPSRIQEAHGVEK